MEKDHLFQGKEIDAILRSAARLQNKDKELKEEQEKGLSLGDLEEIAKESGIDPVFVRQAAFLGDEAEFQEKKFHIFGAPTTASESFVIDRVLSREERESLVPKIREIHKVEGFVDSLHDSLVWHETQSKRSQPRNSVSILSDDHKTIVQVKSRTWFMGFIMHYVAILPVILVALPLISNSGFTIGKVAIAAVVMASLILAARFGYAKYHDGRMDKLNKTKKSILKATATKGRELEANQINLDNLDYDTEESESETSDSVRTRS